ncbi:MAG: hypothetical protein RL065_1332 [Bacteroidota bacterium]
MKRIFLLLFIILLSRQFCFSKNSIKNIFQPSLCFGYNIHGRLYYGFDFAFQFSLNPNSSQQNFIGVSYSKQWTQVIKGAKRNIASHKGYMTHRLNFLNFIYNYNNQLNSKIGFGLIRNPWGFGNANLCRIGGINFQVEGNVYPKTSTWIGGQFILYPVDYWIWNYEYYKAVYVNERPDLSMIKFKH